MPGVTVAGSLSRNIGLLRTSNEARSESRPSRCGSALGSSGSGCCPAGANQNHCGEGAPAPDNLACLSETLPAGLNEPLLLMKSNTPFKERILIPCGFFLVLFLPLPGMAQILTNSPLALPALRTNASRAPMLEPPMVRLWSGVSTQTTAQVEPTAASAIEDSIKSFTNKLYQVRLAYDCSSSGFG